MSTYVLYFRGPGAAPQKDIEQILEHKGVHVIDHSSAKMLLLESDSDAFLQDVSRMKNWVASRKKEYHLIG
ncbi:hypothetical protein ACKI2N_015590 [Cupriavidus sp. 30B13]|uniref:hypothetical protein n=1 Tax=Cupriavidus sp. 30B13 TaxID=3384241 RepID=UPI003B91C216